MNYLNFKPMKKNFYLLAFAAIFSFSIKAQKAIIVNGGEYGNPLEDVTVLIYDPSTDSSTFLDTIHSQSVQDVLVDSIYAFVAAQDSIVKYNLETEKRITSTSFEGLSTKSMAVYKDYLLVGNWYGKTSSNLYIYDKNVLSLVDSIVGVSKGVNSMLIVDSIVYLSQNETNANYEDTLGYIARLNLNKLTQLSNLIPQNYSGDIGQLIAKGNGFFAANSYSNTFLEYADLQDTTGSLYNFPFDLQLNSRSQYSIQEDTLYLKYNERIGSVNMNNFTYLDTSIVDTVITAFTFDTLSQQFYVTQTDYFSYNKGAVYSHDGSKLSTMEVGYSPEVISMYYQKSSTGIEAKHESLAMAKIFPNPAQDDLHIELSESLPDARLKIYDIKGQLLLEKNLKGMNKKLNIAQLKAGVYIVLLESDYKISTARLIKL